MNNRLLWIHRKQTCGSVRKSPWAPARLVTVGSEAAETMYLCPTGAGQHGLLQVVRNLVDPWSGFLHDSRLLIHDRSALFSESFGQVLRSARVEALRLPARSPNLNAYAERLVRTIREECLDRMVFFGEAALRRAVKEFVVHYNGERNHQSLANKIIQPEAAEFPCIGRIRRRKRLGGLLNYYYREATR